MSLLEQITPPTGQPAFSTWLTSYTGAKSTLSDVLTAFAAYKNSGSDDPVDPPDPGPEPTATGRATSFNATASYDLSDRSLIITATGNCDGAGKRLNLEYSTDGSHWYYAGITTVTTGTTYTLSGKLPANIPGNASMLNNTLRIRASGYTSGSSSLPGTIAGMKDKPGWQTQQFYNIDYYDSWLKNTYTGAKTTLNDILAALEVYLTQPTGPSLEVSWNNTSKWLSVKSDFYVPYDDTFNVYVWDSDGNRALNNYGGDKTAGSTYHYSPVYALTNTDLIDDFKGWHFYAQNADEEFYLPVANDDLTLVGMLNMITVPNLASYHYTSSSFGAWLNNEYASDAYYNQPYPLNVNQLITAFDHYYNGTKPADVPPFDPSGPKYPSATPASPGYTQFSIGDEASVTKKIDWLGKDASGAAVDGMEDLYRLYLNFRMDPTPIDLLLVVDQSGSMGDPLTVKDAEGNVIRETTRQEEMLRFLNGNEDAQGRHDGFIHSFLEENSDNYLAVVTFASDSSTVTESYTNASGVTVPERYIYQWNHKGTNDDFVDHIELDEPDGATNYAAGLAAADAVWDMNTNTGHRKVMIFLSDGEPTLAYSDGQMHTGFSLPDTVKVVGTGNNNKDKSYVVVTAFNNYLANVDRDADEARSKENAAYDEKRRGGFTYADDKNLLDDQGKGYARSRWISNWVDEVPSFPVFTAADEILFDRVPGIASYPYGAFVNSDSSTVIGNTFKQWFGSLDYNEKAAWVKGGLVNGVVEQSHVSSMPTYDLFQLCESAYKEFHDSSNHPDVVTYCIGYGGGVDDTYPNGRPQSEVLTYMSGTDRFYPCSSAEDLTTALQAITRAKNLVMTDDLSDYVKPAAQPGLKLTLKIGNGSAVTLYDQALVDATHDGFTEEGNAKLNKELTSLDANSMKVVFKEGIYFTEDIDLKAEFTVQTNGTARSAYIENGRNYGGTVGDGTSENLLTDYDTAHPTSSGLPGFYSNKNSSKASYDKYDQSWDLAFPMPVVQVHNVPDAPAKPDDVTYTEHKDNSVVIGKRIDDLSDNGIDGMDDLYRLYLSLEHENEPIDLLLVIDQSASMADTVDGKTADDSSANPNNHSRQKKLVDFLDGTAADGFISSFLSANSKNDLAILTFAQDCSYTDKRYVRNWGSDKTDVTVGYKLDPPAGATNYTAAYAIADRILGDKDTEDAAKLAEDPDFTPNRKILIFLSDGMPTLAYADGHMQSSFAKGNVVGSGREYGATSLTTLIFAYGNYAERELSNAGYVDRNTWYHSLIVPGNLTQTDDAVPANTHYSNRFISLNSTQQTDIQDVDFPVIYDAKTMDINLPGVIYPLGAFSEPAGTTFTSWYDNWKNLEAAQQLSELLENLTYQGDKYDLFYLTESSFREFKNANPNVDVYTLSFGNEFEGENENGNLPSGRPAAEVLEYMAGYFAHEGADPVPTGRYYPCETGEKLQAAINSITGITQVHLHDTLSEYVDFQTTIDSGTGEATVTPQLEITLTDAKYSDYYAEDKDFAYLYQNGTYTALGQTLLVTETEEGEAVQPFNASDKSVDVVFKPGIAFTENMKVEASFVIKPNQTALSIYKASGYPAGMTGDINNDGTDETKYITDYDLRSNDTITSSGKTGFYSNLVTGENRARATWEHDGDQTRNFPKPVVQAPADPEEPPVINHPDYDFDVSKKIDYLGDDGAIGTSDLYRLYLTTKVDYKPIDLLLVVDESKAMWNFVTSVNNALNGNGGNAGFIESFLTANPENDLAILTFDSDSDATDAHYLYGWGDGNGSNPSYMMRRDLKASGGSNYSAAFDAAADVWALKPHTDHQRVMVFLATSEPTYAYTDGKPHTGTTGRVGSDTASAATFNDAIRSGYDLFKLTERAFASFVNDGHEDIIVYTIGHGNVFVEANNYTVDGKTRERAEVLKYMAGTDRYTYTAQSFDPLRNSLKQLYAGVSGTITDPLSGYADLAEDTKLEITLEIGGETKTLYENGKLTTDGYTYLEESSNVILNDLECLSVTIPASKPIRESFELTASFNIRPGGLAYVNPYKATGDINEDGATDKEKYITDYDPEHHTSSGEPGFWSNDNAAAKVELLFNGDESEKNFPKPVIQANPFRMSVTKKVSGNETTDAFPFTFTVTDKNGAPVNMSAAASDTLTVSGGDSNIVSFNLKDGETVIIPELPYNAKITLEETSVPEGCSVKIAESGTVTNGATFNVAAVKSDKAVTVYNIWQPEAPVKPEDPGYGELVLPEVKIGKQIDYLADNEDYTGDNDLYRLYLTMKGEVKPTDLLLVVDQSGSMLYDMAGHKSTDAGYQGPSRQENLLDFLNGTKDEGGNYKGDGFIADFLTANPNNDLAILTFNNDSGNTAKRVIHSWGDRTNMTIDPETPEGATNYAAALYAADQVWDAKSESTNQKIMIFLSDGEPTVAYADGTMKNGAAGFVGSGNPLSANTIINNILSDFWTGPLIAINEDAKAGQYSTENRESRWLATTVSAFNDDNGVPFVGSADYTVTTKDFGPQFPLIHKYSNYLAVLPGLTEYPLGAFTEASCQTFKNFYKDFLSAYTTSTDREALFNSIVLSPGETYDLFYLSESAYKYFAAENADVVTYTIGYASDFYDATAEDHKGRYEGSGREKAEVLEYMSGSDRFFLSENSSKLEESIISIVSGVSSIKMEDGLSEYVDLPSDKNFTVTLELGKAGENGYQNLTLYSYDEDSETYKMTADGEKYLKSVSLENKKLQLEFKENLSQDFVCTASFDVKVNETALNKYIEIGGYPEGMIGDINAEGTAAEDIYITDKDLRVIPSASEASTITSSGQPGFWSNDDTAEASWVIGGTPDEEDFPKPVVQVPPSVTIKLCKTNGTEGYTPDRLAGAEFDLYLECNASAAGAEQIPGTADKYGIKVNNASIKSSATEDTVIEDLKIGTYYLVENKAPDGYMLPEAPFVFDIYSRAIVENDENLAIGETDPLLLYVKNRSGYELPSTGGTGKQLYALGALMLMVSTLMYGCMMRRRRERRYD